MPATRGWKDHPKRYRYIRLFYKKPFTLSPLPIKERRLFYYHLSLLGDLKIDKTLSCKWQRLMASLTELSVVWTSASSTRVTIFSLDSSKLSFNVSQTHMCVDRVCGIQSMNGEKSTSSRWWCVSIEFLVQTREFNSQLEWSHSAIADLIRQFIVNRLG